MKYPKFPQAEADTGKTPTPLIVNDIQVRVGRTLLNSFPAIVGRALTCHLPLLFQRHSGNEHYNKKIEADILHNSFTARLVRCEFWEIYGPRGVLTRLVKWHFTSRLALITRL